VSWTIAIRGSDLVATMVRDREVTLRPLFRDGFSADGAIVEFQRDPRGRVEALLVTPGRSRNIRFERVAAQ
jgi:hypothetical protein